MSSICHLTLNNLAVNMEDKTWTKIGLYHFSICHLVTLHLDKSWTISGLVEGQSRSTFCLNTSCPTYVHLLSKPRNVPLAHGPWPTHRPLTTRTLPSKANYGLWWIALGLEAVEATLVDLAGRSRVQVVGRPGAMGRPQAMSGPREVSEI